jgi:uncharacterized protein YybS (DUF2232 family)
MMQRPLPLLSLGKAVAGTVIIAVLSVFLLPLAPVLILFLPLPAAYVTARHGWIGGLVVAAISAALLYFGAGSGTALLAFLLVVSVGMAFGWALRSGWRFPRSLAVCTVSLLVAVVVYGLVLWLAFGLGLADLKTEAYRSISDAGAMYSQLGMSSATIDSVSAEFRDLVDIFPYLAPGVVGMGIVLLAAATIGLAYLVFPRLRRPQIVSMSISTFRLHWGVAYVSIVGLAMLLFTRSGTGWRAVVFYAGIDLLLVSQTLFFLQALAVIRWLGTARQWRPGSRVLLFICAVIAQSFQLTGLVGLLDTWIDYRKRFALTSSGPRSLR